MHLLVISLTQASAIALIAIALALILRSTGVFVLETTVFGTAIALALATIVFRQSSAAPEGQWFFVSAVIALIMSAALLTFYRLCRAARGGDATTLMMSFALMNSLSLLTTKLTDGKSVSIDADKFGNPLLLGFLGWGALIGLYLVSRQSGERVAAIKLARDNDALLATFGLSGRKIRFLTIFGACGLLALGVVLYILQQENFAAHKFEVYLIPAFSVAIFRQRLGTISIGCTAFFLLFIEKLMEAWGAPILIRAYQSMILVILALLVPSAAAVYQRVRNRSLSRREIRVDLGIPRPEIS